MHQVAFYKRNPGPNMGWACGTTYLTRVEPGLKNQKNFHWLHWLIRQTLISMLVFLLFGWEINTCMYCLDCFWLYQRLPVTERWGSTREKDSHLVSEKPFQLHQGIIRAEQRIRQSIQLAIAVLLKATTLVTKSSMGWSLVAGCEQ